MKPRDMTPRQRAMYLADHCLMTWEDACNAAGYDPAAEYQREALTFVVAIASIALLIAALAFAHEYLPSAVAK